MRKSYLFAAGVMVASSAAFGSSQGSRQKAEPVACKALHDDYEEASKRTAMNRASGLGDNSAVRATTRETENASIMAEAQVTPDLLKGNGCRLPTSAPSRSRYYFRALQCHNDMLAVRLSGKYKFPPSCERAKWTPDASELAN